MHELHTEIDIAAAPERVWEILTDFASYPRWNPFIRHIDGTPEAGKTLRARIEPSGGRGLTIRPTVLIADRARELRWLGRLLIPGIFDGEHRFVIEPLADGTVRFHQSERFSGLLVPLLRGMLDRDTRRGFTEMNAALKRLAEGA
jgi:hypothetical protein